MKDQPETNDFIEAIDPVALVHVTGGNYAIDDEKSRGVYGCPDPKTAYYLPPGCPRV